MGLWMEISFPNFVFELRLNAEEHSNGPGQCPSLAESRFCWLYATHLEVLITSSYDMKASGSELRAWPPSRGPSSPLRSRPAVLLCFSHFLIGYLRAAFVCRPCRLNGEAFPLSLRSFYLLRTSGCFRFCSNLAAVGIMNSLDLRWCLHYRPGNTPYGSVPDLLYTYLSVRPRLPSSSAERRGYPCPSQ